MKTSSIVDDRMGPKYAPGLARLWKPYKKMQISTQEFSVGHVLEEF